MDLSSPHIMPLAVAFKEGWDRAGRQGTVTPELAAAWMESYGIDMTRVQSFADAQWAHMTGKGPKPHPADFR